MLYGLVHVRYILTARGMAAMFEKYKAAEFGRCPRVNCGGQACLPVGTSDVPRQVGRRHTLEMGAAAVRQKTGRMLYRTMPASCCKMTAVAAPNICHDL